MACFSRLTLFLFPVSYNFGQYQCSSEAMSDARPQHNRLPLPERRSPWPAGPEKAPALPALPACPPVPLFRPTASPYLRVAKNTSGGGFTYATKTGAIRS